MVRKFKYIFDEMFMSPSHYFTTRKSAERSVEFWGQSKWIYKIVPTKKGGILGKEKGSKVRYRRKGEF